MAKPILEQWLGEILEDVNRMKQLKMLSLYKNHREATQSLDKLRRHYATHKEDLSQLKDAVSAYNKMRTAQKYNDCSKYFISELFPRTLLDCPSASCDNSEILDSLGEVGINSSPLIEALVTGIATPRSIVQLYVDQHEALIVETGDMEEILEKMTISELGRVLYIHEIADSKFFDWHVWINIPVYRDDAIVWVPFGDEKLRGSRSQPGDDKGVYKSNSPPPYVEYLKSRGECGYANPSLQAKGGDTISPTSEVI